MNDPDVKKCLEETKKEMNGFKLTSENKNKLMRKLSEIDEDKDCHFQTVIEQFGSEITNQPESIQNSTNDTTNQMRSEESNHNESAFKSSSNEVNPNSFGGESKGVDDIMNVDETKIEDIAEKIYQCLKELVDDDRCGNFLTTLLKD
jgi:hypothetical protein